MQLLAGYADKFSLASSAQATWGLFAILLSDRRILPAVWRRTIYGRLHWQDGGIYFPGSDMVPAWDWKATPDALGILSVLHPFETGLKAKELFRRWVLGNWANAPSRATRQPPLRGCC